jgi:predicted  nucleic acid-binding Zn-ribbon protein
MSDDPILAAIEAVGAKLSGEIAELRTGMMGRMDRLQARIDQLGDEWFVAYAQHEGLGRRIDNARSETTDIREQISGLVRQVRALRDRLDGLEGP